MFHFEIAQIHKNIIELVGDKRNKIRKILPGKRNVYNNFY